MYKRLFFITFVTFVAVLFSGDSGMEMPYKYRSQAINLYKSGDYNKSISFYLKILNSYPEDELLMSYLANSYLNIGRYKDAERVYINMVKLNKNNKNARAGLFVLYDRFIKNAVAQKNYNLAFDYVKKGEYFLPDNSNFYALDADLNFNIHNIYDAALLYEKSWRIDYEKTGNVVNPWKLKKYGECLYRLGGEYPNVWKKYMSDIIKEHPDNRDILILTADAYFFNNENPSKRNKLRNKAMELYQKENNGRRSITISFPLEGRFQLVSGYNEHELDTHNGYDSYCIDIIKIDENGSRLKHGTGGVNSDYLSFGAPIYAVLDGYVEKVVDQHNDNVVGHTSYFTPNVVKIRHTENGFSYFSFYVHLKKGSAKVKPGQFVKKGEIIGEIGNSGYSFAPHLHFGIYDAFNVSMPLIFDDINLAGYNGKESYRFKHGSVFSKIQPVAESPAEKESSTQN